MLERNIPLSPRNTSRNRPQGKEFDRVLPEDPIRVTHDGGLLDAGRMAENRGPLFGRIQCFPPPAVCFESLAAIGQGCFRPRVMLQSGTKEVDLVLGRGRDLYETMESVIDLSRLLQSVKTRI